jgi:hypothetical protein
MMVAMEHPGKGHEKKKESAEGHAGKHSKWKEKMITGLKVAGVGLGVMLAGPGLLVAAGTMVPDYILGAGAAAYYLKKKNAAKKGGAH